MPPATTSPTRRSDDPLKLAMTEIERATILLYAADQALYASSVDSAFWSIGNHHRFNLMQSLDICANTGHDVPPELRESTVWLQTQLAERNLECALLRLKLAHEQAAAGYEREMASADAEVVRGVVEGSVIEY